MPPIAVADTFRVAARQIVSLEEVVNVWHVRQTDNTRPDPELDIITAFIGFYEGLSTAAAPNRGIDDFRSNDAVLESITVTDIEALPYPAPTIASRNNAGGSAAAILPLQNALVVSLRTPLGGRRGRGRIYLGGWTEDDTIEDTAGFSRWSQTLIDAVDNAVVDLQERLNANGYELVVVSTVDAAARAVTSIVTRNRVATQRRRQKEIPVTYTNVTTLPTV